MNGVSKATSILAKIVEVAMWVATGILAVTLIVTAIGGSSAIEALDGKQNGLITYGVTIEGMRLADFSASSSITAGQLVGVVITGCVFGILMAVLVAMVFRNVHLIIKTSYGLTKFSKGATPFQPDVIRMMREIGIFLIAQAALKILMGIVLTIVAGPDVIEGPGLDLASIFAALIVFSLVQIFNYGASLQGDVDGLL